MHQHPRLLPLGVMSARLGITSRNLRLAAVAGDIPSITVGKDGLLFDPEAVEQALLSRSRCGTPGPQGDAEARDVG